MFEEPVAKVEPRSPSVGLAFGAVLIVAAVVLSIAHGHGFATSTASLILGAGFLAPLVTRWPVTRRRTVVIGVAWLVVGAVIVLPAFWLSGSIVPVAAGLGAVPALIGAGVGWD